MPRVWRVRNRASFAALRRDGSRRRSGPISVLRLLDPEPGVPPRVAYAIGRDVGTAVDRNRLKRRLRAVVAEVDPAPGRYLIRAGAAANTLPHQDLRAHLGEVLS